MTTYNADDLTKRYQELTAIVRCDCVSVTEIVGGQPADEKGVRAFVQHHLKLEGEEAEKATARILREELGEKDVPAPEGELQEKQVYGLYALRSTDFGPWVGDWMIKACFKQAASRLDIFRQVKGSKGDFAEAGQVLAAGGSLLEADNPNHIYLLAPDGMHPVRTNWQEFMGKVSTPQGSKSIIHHSECAPPGTRFSWEMRFLSARVVEDDVRDVLALMMVVGLGSARSLERGKFKIERAEITLKPKVIRTKDHREKPGKLSDIFEEVPHGGEQNAHK